MSETGIPKNAERPEAPQSSQHSLDAPGVQLKARREAMGWSVQQVADQLKLAPRQVIALEDGDVAALPNMAVVRGFVRAYAKVVKLDPVPLVAMIAVHTSASESAAGVPPPRREGTATFSEVRFPSMTQRSLMSRGWFIAIVLLALLLGAYKMGFFASLMPAPADKAGAALVKPGLQLAPLQSKSVPLISVPPVAGAASAPPPVAGFTPRDPAAAAPLAAVPSNALVLTVRDDAWIELRSNGAAPLISRTVKAGSVETFDITSPAQLVVGNVPGVTATLRGTPLILTPANGGTTTRMTIE